MISKELLSEVLQLDVVLVDDKYTHSTSRVRYVKNCGSDYYINIHELEHKLKEWLRKVGAFYKIIEYKDRYTVDLAVKTFTFVSKGDCFSIDYRDKFDTLIKACQWKLDKDNKC